MPLFIINDAFKLSTLVSLAYYIGDLDSKLLKYNMTTTHEESILPVEDTTAERSASVAAVSLKLLPVLYLQWQSAETLADTKTF